MNVKNFLTPYRHLKGYLERWTILKIGRLHVRIHAIKRNDATPFLHNHPFNYISFILNGGYAEEINGVVKKHRRGSIIIRKNDDYHRIVHVDENTRTLFFAWAVNKKWELKPAMTTNPNWVAYKPGVYLRNLWGKLQYCKFDKYWHKGSETFCGAIKASTPSIDQTTQPIERFNSEK